MKRKIRLTESEFHSLIKRLVIETQEEMNTEMGEEMDMEMGEEMDMEMGEDDVVEKIQDVVEDELGDEFRQLSSDELMTMIRNLEKVENMIRSKERRTGEEILFDEFVDEVEGVSQDEMSENIDARSSKMRKRAKMIGGAGLLAAGLLTLMSQGTTYTEWGSSFIDLHDAIKGVFGKYAPNVGLLEVVTGLGLALNGIAQEQKENEEREIQKENYLRRKYRRY
jgi:hypothetical protein